MTIISRGMASTSSSGARPLRLQFDHPPQCVLIFRSNCASIAAQIGKFQLQFRIDHRRHSARIGLQDVDQAIGRRRNELAGPVLIQQVPMSGAPLAADDPLRFFRWVDGILFIGCRQRNEIARHAAEVQLGPPRAVAAPPLFLDQPRLGNEDHDLRKSLGIAVDRDWRTSPAASP